MTLPDIPQGAVQAAARAMVTIYQGFQADGATSVDEEAARAALAAAAPILAAQERAAAIAAIHTIVAEVRQGTAERIAAALLAVDPVEWALAGQHAGEDAARIARQIGEGQ